MAASGEASAQSEVCAAQSCDSPPLQSPAQISRFYQQELAAIWSMGFDADVVQVWFRFNPNFGLGLTQTLV